MLLKRTNKISSIVRKAGISLCLAALVALAFGSKGGGGDEKKSSAPTFKSHFAPVRTFGGFTLRPTTPMYSGSKVVSLNNNEARPLVNTVITYQKGHTIYVIPYKYNTPSRGYQNYNNSLQLVGVKIRMPR